MFLVLPLLSLSPHAPAPADREARAIVEKAVAAHGGEAVLVRPVRYRSKGWDADLNSGDQFRFDAETVERLPDDRRRTVQYARGDQMGYVTTLWSGGRVWVNRGGWPGERSGTALQAERQALHVRRVQTLVPLLKGGHILSPLGKGRVGDAPTVGVRVAAAGYEDVDLWFDAGTGLLAKVAYRSVSRVDGRPLAREMVHSGYRVWDGRQVPARSAFSVDGVAAGESEVYEHRVLAAVDDAEFDPAVVLPADPTWWLVGGAAVLVGLPALVVLWACLRPVGKGAPEPQPGAGPPPG